MGIEARGQPVVSHTLNVSAAFDTRKLAVMLAGACAFLQIYITQPLLPMLTEVFHASKVAVSATVTAAGLGVAAGAPFAGYISDRLGRKTVIVWSAFLLAATAFGTATAPSLGILILWRFCQGLFTPGIFAITIAYINDEWAGMGAPKMVANYVTGTVLGGFTSRMLSGLVAAHAAWPWTFVVIGSLSLAAAIAIARWLPPEKRFHHRAHTEHSGWAAAREHLRNKPLLATFAVGFCVLFSMVATFTYVTFYLADPPFGLRPAALGSIFAVYLIGAAVTPSTGHAIDRFGSRAALAAAIAAGVGGVAITLIPNLWAVALGLAITSSGVFVAQAAASSFIGIAAKQNRALAVGLYASFYYVGGSVGAALPGYVWDLGGWPACVVFIAAVQILTVAIALVFWEAPTAPAPAAAWAGPAELK
ncbi:MAG TPA: MFS transporter [Bryobacteraceae bacterium]|nr:MFS transporter [Bryobacteraceae bacterium]